MSQTAQEEATRRLGANVGDWKLETLLGVGGTAAVYAAVHEQAGRHAAVKLMHPHLAQDGEAVARFLGEGDVLKSVGHPGLVRHIESGRLEDGLPFLVCELLEGQTAEQLRSAAGGRLARVTSLSIVDLTLDVLMAAHGAGYVHRDIKPSNLFWTSGGRLKLLDFGSARGARPASSGMVSTEVGALVGTPSFMAPEQARGHWELVDARADLWSLGATLFTLLSGETVHGGEHRMEVLTNAMTLPARSLREAQPDLPEGVIRFVDRALEYYPQHRWQTAEEMRAALARVMRGDPLAAAAPPPSSIGPMVTLRPTPPPEGAARPGWFRTMAPALAIVAVLGAVAFSLWANGGGEANGGQGERPSSTSPAEPAP